MANDNPPAPTPTPWWADLTKILLLLTTLGTIVNGVINTWNNRKGADVQQVVSDAKKIGEDNSAKLDVVKEDAANAKEDAAKAKDAAKDVAKKVDKIDTRTDETKKHIDKIGIKVGAGGMNDN